VTSAGVEKHRVVQVTAFTPGRKPVKGSGYLAGAGLVLTAAHTVQHAVTVTVLRILRPGQTAAADAVVVWLDLDEGIDLAVLRLTASPADAAAFPADLPAPRYGRVTEPVACEAVGFPLFKKPLTSEGSFSGGQPGFRDSHHAVGTTSPLSNLREGSLEVTVPPPGNDPDKYASPWQGMSGAALFADGALVGLICRHRRQEGLRRLTANRVEAWYDLEPDALAALRDLLILPERDRLEAVPSVPVLMPTAIHQLPSSVPSFTGRADELRDLLDCLSPGTATGEAVVSAVAGLPGVGKTALAVHAAHAAVEAGYFPGGVLFLDLHGYDEAPLDPAQALDALLRALGVAGTAIPRDVQAQTGLYRTLLAERGQATLIVIDNASTSDQVLPLLPGDGRHRVLVTSRHTLTRLGARQLDLNILPPQQAVELLQAALRTATKSGERISADRAGAGRVSLYCGYLPLALQIAAALLAADSGQSLAELADQLADSTTRLADLDDGEQAVLTAGLARLFRLLALNPGPDLSTAAAAVLAGVPVVHARRMLGDLARAHLLERATTRGRWRMHDLIRAYARGLAAREPEPDRRASVQRLLEYYLHGTRAAELRLAPGPGTTAQAGAPEPDAVVTVAVPHFANRGEALAWLEAERRNLEACVTLATDAGDIRVTGIAHAAAVFFHQAGYWRQGSALHQAAAGVAKAMNDQLAHAHALSDLADIQRLLGENAQASDHLTEALALYRDLGHRLGQGNALTYLGIAQRLLGEYVQASAHLAEALALYRDLGNLLGQANTLRELGAVQRLLGDYVQVSAHLVEALALYRDLGDRFGQANTLRELGIAQKRTDTTTATTYLMKALSLYYDLGDRLGQANTLRELGAVRQLTGEYAQASAHLTAALALYRDLGHRLGQGNALTYLGIAQRLLGEYVQASVYLAEALALYRDLGNPLGQANTLRELGVVHRLTGTYVAAGTHFTEALALYRDIGDRGGEVEALNHYAVLVAATDTPALGRAVHAEALSLAREVDSKWDEANAFDGIASTYLAEGNRLAAEECLQQALQLYRLMRCAADVARVEDALANLANTDSPNREMWS
jgi:tetratricopeptide (TPR) repeat protein